MEAKKKKNLVANCAFAVKTIFRYAPIISTVYLVVTIVAAFFTPLSIYFLARLIDTVTAYVKGSADLGKAILWGGIYVLSLLGIEIWNIAGAKIGRYMNRKLRNSLSPAIIKKYNDVEYHYFEQQEFKDLAARVGAHPARTIIHGTYFCILAMVMCLIRFFGTIALFFAASVWLGVGAVLISIPIIILQSKVESKRAKLQKEGTEDQRVADYLQGLFYDKNVIYETKIFSSFSFLQGLWKKAADKNIKRHGKIVKANLRVFVVESILKITYTVFAVAMLVYSFINGNIGLGVLISILGAMPSLFGLINGVAEQAMHLTLNNVNVQYFYEFLSCKERAKNESKGISKFADIVFDNITFAYPGTERTVLKDLSFCINSGQKAAIVGVNGAGKSTIIKLLCGLYKPDSGHIYIDGKDITTLSQDDVRAAVSVVFQDFARYQMSLRENIAFGDLSSINDDERLSTALKRASGDEVLAKGLNTNLGRLHHDGIDVSTGQWQRIAIARAFLSKANFVILDEPTASLDPIAESNMYSAFDDILASRGTIIISHRLASAKMADKIIVIDEGKVIGEGNHSQLMDEDGVYAKMFKEQSSWYVKA